MGINLLPREVADRFRMNMHTLANWRLQGRGPKFIKCGKKVLYPLVEVEAWEKANLRTATTEVV